VKTTIKASLDVILCIGFLSLLEPKIGPLAFHEWGGLAVCVLFLVHKLLNWEWIKAVTTRLFSKTLPSRVRRNYILDLILLVGFILITVSGMAIAKTIDFTWLFPNKAGLMPRLLHGFASLLILAAVGVHIGLHWSWIAARLRNKPAAGKEIADAR